VRRDHHEEKGITMKKTLIVALSSVLVGAGLSAVPASAAPFPQFWTDSTKTTLLRSVTSVPKSQPDAMEFANNGPVLFANRTKEEPPIFCNEVEFGTTVVVNSGALETKLALPFGVAEGDNCNQDNPAGVVNVPTYFDTGANGVVPATITVTGGPPFIATVHKLKLSQNRPAGFCTVNLEGIKGELHNVVEGFVEEAPPNLNVGFEGVPITTTCGKKKFAEIFVANFFLETMSTTTDTAFIG
jgi:hypothetical protein